MYTRLVARRHALIVTTIFALTAAHCASGGAKKLPSTAVAEGSDFAYTKNDRLSCGQTPAGMVCVEPAGANVAFADQAAVTNAEYSRCVADGQCVAGRTGYLYDR